MRSVYGCVICGVHYMPPEAMEYPALELKASAAHCARPECAAAAAAGAAGLPVEVLELLARRAAEERGKAQAPCAVGRTRGRRAAAAPGGGRSKLR